MEVQRRFIIPSRAVARSRPRPRTSSCVSDKPDPSPEVYRVLVSFLRRMDRLLLIFFPYDLPRSSPDVELAMR
jgi:hypothetical protein